MSDFARACREQGDINNYYRWKMVRQEARRGYTPPAPKSVAPEQQQHSLPLM